jgi:SH3-like domain-containing protein
MPFYTFLQSRARSIIAAGVTCFFMMTPVYAAEFVSVSSDNVNVRTEPNTSSPVFMELFKGYPLKVEKKQGEWVQISDFEGDSGWIHSSLIGRNDTVIINAKKSVNMRSGPSTTSAVVADVERGVIMTKVSENGKWVQVKHSTGTIGWIYSPLLWP